MKRTRSLRKVRLLPILAVVLFGVGGIVLTYFIFVSSWLSPGHVETNQVKVRSSSRESQRGTVLATPETLLVAVNERRQANGVAPLVIAPELARSAQQKCSDMATEGYWDHINPKTGVPGTEYARSALRKAVLVAENLRWTSQPESGAQAVDGWVTSPPHKAAILDSRFNYTGFAVCTIEKLSRIAIVEHFAQVP